MVIKALTDNEDDDQVVELEEVEEDLGEENFSKAGKDVWVNEVLTPIRSPITCRIPQKVVIIMRTIEQLMYGTGMGTLEFGIFVKGKLDENGILMLTEEFYIGEQRVTGVSIDFDEEPPNPSFNGVIHRHPSGCKSFSGTDDIHINQNFDFSLLFVNNVINCGIINVKLDNGLRLQVPLDIEVMYPITQMDVSEITNKIKKEEVKSSSSRSCGLEDGRDFNHRLLFDDVPLLGEGTEIEDASSNDEEIGDDEDDEDGLLHICKKCGDPQFILEFPILCESCEEWLDEDDAELITDVTELDEDTQQRVYEAMEVNTNR